MKIRIGLELMVDCAAQEMSLAQDLEFERETERDDVEPKERDMAPGPKAQQ
jgi:ABC transporter ATM